MDPWPFVLIVGTTLGLLSGFAWAGWHIRDLRRVECQVAGRRLDVRAWSNRKELLVDGRVVAARTTHARCAVTLVSTIEVDGETIGLEAVVTHPSGGAAEVRVYADGRHVGGDPPAQARAPAPEPSDSRWAAAAVLLRDVHASEDARLHEAAERVQTGLRDALGRLARLNAARHAHATLDSDVSVLEGARDRLDHRVSELVDALRALHLAAVVGGTPTALDPIDELLGRLTAEAEVEETIASRARRARSVRTS